MKKYFSNIFALAALLMAGAAFSACSSDDNSIEQPANPSGEKTYTLTVNASKGDAATRALNLDGTKLVASWENGDQLSVFNKTKGAALTGSLTAKNANGDEATFSGSLTGEIDVNDELTLSYHQPAGFNAYAAQNGTLASAAERDFATATVTVASVNAGEITISETSASFQTQTAMLKLTLTDGTNKLNATQLKLSATMTMGGPMTVDIATFNLSGDPYSTNGDGILYFALPNASLVAEYVAGRSGEASPSATMAIAALLPTATLTYTATVGSDTYTATKTGYTFAAGKYYAGTLTMAKAAPSYDKEMNLSTTSSDVTVPAGEHWLIKGSKGNICVTIGDGATVTLNGVEINMNTLKPCIKCSGDATIILADGTTNTLTAVSDGGGIQAGPSGKTLTIKGNTGVLNVEIKHDSDAAAIGAYYEDYSGTPCGDIVIEGGVINATSQNGAAIGACYEAACGNITISGGTVTAKAESEYLPGVGIGGHYNTACGNIKITGGTVTATGYDEPGIGGDNICGDITISGGTVKATKGEYADKCIGTNNGGTCGTITIGGKVYWDGSNYQNGGDTYLTQDQIIYPAP